MRPLANILSILSLLVLGSACQAGFSSSVPCMITTTGDEKFVSIYAAADPSQTPLTDIAPGETGVARLGPQVQLDGQTWIQIRYDGMTAWLNARDLICRLTPIEAKSQIDIRAQHAIRALQARDMKRFSALVHPEHGVRLSPYGYVETEQDVVFTPKQVAMLAGDTGTRRWGYFAGSGEPIDLSFREYYKRFIFDRDFADTKAVSYNETHIQGNTADNSFEVYPEAIVVEFHVPGSEPKDEGSNWRSLRLAFEERERQWYVVGIIHDEWTP